MRLLLLRIVEAVWLRLEKLRSLSAAQFAVVKKYPCVRCFYFGFSIYKHVWMCELDLSLIGESCGKFLLNDSLFEVVKVDGGGSVG